METINNLNIFFQWILIVLLFGCFILFLIKSIKLEMKSQKRVFLGYGLFLLLYGITRLFLILATLCYDICEDLRSIYLMIGWFVGSQGVIVIIYIMETYLLKTRKIFTTLSITFSLIVLLALMGLTTKDIANNMMYILMPVVIFVVCICYIYLIIKTPGASRKRAIWALLGIIAIFIGAFIDTHEFRVFIQVYIDYFPYYISPIIIMIGVLIFTISQLRKI